jgi:hypothetical protein
MILTAGERCEWLLESQIRNVEVKDVQCDEIWTFGQKKEGHKWPYEAHAEEIGDAYTFIGSNAIQSLSSPGISASGPAWQPKSSLRSCARRRLTAGFRSAPMASARM